MSAIQQVMLGGGLYGKTLMQVLTDATLTTNLKLCLDAGDASSYDPAVQTDKWLDVAGSGYDFYRGLGTGSEVQDPTFTGVASSLQSYWAFDGADYFTYDTTNEAWMETLHKNAAVFSVVMFFYSPGTSFSFNTDTGTGTGIYVTSSPNIAVDVSNAGSSSFSKTSDAAVGASNWHMIGVSISENAGAAGGFFYKDGAYAQSGSSDTWNPNYTSPSAGSSSQPMRLGFGAFAGKNDSGTRLSSLAVWQGTALTKANMDTIWAAMRGRFGI